LGVAIKPAHAPRIPIGAPSVTAGTVAAQEAKEAAGT